MSADRAKQLLQQGIAAAKAGQKEQARQLLQQAVRLDPQNETTWLWLSSVARDDKERIFCLKQILEINPENELAIKGLRQLGVEPAQAQQPATSVPLVTANRLSKIQNNIDEFLRTYSQTPRTVLDVEWVHKTKRRYAEGRAARLRRTAFLSAAAVITLLLVGAVLVIISLDIETPFTEEEVMRPTLTPSATPTVTPTATPGVANTATPRPAVTRTPIQVPQDLPVGDPFRSTPTAIYPPFNPAVDFQMRQAAIAYTIGDYASVEEISSTIRDEQFRNCYPETYYYEALALADQGEFNDAVNLLETGLTRETEGSGSTCADSALLLTGLCQVTYDQATSGSSTNASLLEDAVNYCQRAINEDELITSAHNTLAKAYIELGQTGQTSAFDFASGVLTEALSEHRTNVDLLLTRADLELARNRPNDALFYVESALTLDPANEMGLRQQTEAFLQIAENAPVARSIPLYADVAISAERYLLFYPGQPIGHVLLAKARLGEGNADRALQSINRVLNVEETLPASAREAIIDAYGLRVSIAINRQDWEMALDDLTRLRELEPNNLQWIELDTEVALRLNDFEQALASVQDGLSILPNQQLVLTQAQLLAQTCQFERDLDCDPETVLTSLTDDFIQTASGTRRGDALLYRAEAAFAQLEERDISDDVRVGELETLLNQANDAITLHQTPEAYFLLGRILERYSEVQGNLGRPEEEVTRLAESLRAYEWVAYWTQFYEYPFGGRVERDIPRVERELEALREDTT